MISIILQSYTSPLALGRAFKRKLSPFLCVFFSCLESVLSALARMNRGGELI